MLRLCGYPLFIFQLSLASGVIADGRDQRTAVSLNPENRSDLQRIPPRFNLLNPDPEPLTMCHIITDSCKPAYLLPRSINQSRPAGLLQETLPVDLTKADGFRFSSDTLDTKLMPDQEPMSHQSIIVMEEDPAVMEAASYLFERYLTMSTLLMYQKGVLCVLRGRPVFRSRDHEVILVGHSSTGTNGTVQLAGYGPEELAGMVSTLNTHSTAGHLGVIRLISCNLGNDLNFMFQLLRALQSLSIDMKLHLHKSFLSVGSNGDIMTRTERVWRSHDHRGRVVAALDQRGELLMMAELGCAGPAFPGYKGNVLYLQTLEWPHQPQMFVPMELRNKYNSIDCLEGLTWSLFFGENDRKRAPDYVPDQSLREAVWLTEPGLEEKDVALKHISNIQDLLVEIRYNAKEEVASDLYYVLNECIYRVHRKNLSVSLVGKFMSSDSPADVESFRLNFSNQLIESSLQELSQGLKASRFIDFCRQTFQFQQCVFNCERWGRYFMVAVFSASVRNFRTFSLFLMSVIGCEVGRSRGADSPLCTAFAGVDHPMATDQTWPEYQRRGFYGCTVDNYEMAPRDRQIWLDQVVAKENALYITSKQMMNAVDHDEQTELDIFGRVKVMNKYVFSSYLEFFRGTPEGKKLKRGCTIHEEFNPDADIQ